MKTPKTNYYMVSVVYTKTQNGVLDIALRHASIEAVSKEEALGKIILQLDSEMKGYALTNKVATKITL